MLLPMTRNARSILFIALLFVAMAVSGCLSGDDPVTPEDPEAVFTWEPQRPMPGDAVAFAASGSSPGIDEATYEWDFKDGNNAEGENVTHTFEEEGDYAVSLTITVPNGDYDSAVQSIVVGGTPEGSLNETYEGSFTLGTPVENGATLHDHDMSVDAAQSDVVILLEATGTNPQFEMTLFDGEGTEVASGSGATGITIEEGELEADSYILRVHMTMGAQASYTVTATGTALPAEQEPLEDEEPPPDADRPRTGI